MPTPNTAIPQSTQAGQSQSTAGPVTNGPAAAAILSAGAGCCALGILAIVADGSKTAGRWLAFYHPSGPLSGVTTVTIFIWLAIWFVFARRWRVRNVNLARTNALAFFLLACGLLLTFPPFADLLLGK
ncbi:MAG TPA: hypothetical protein VJN93_06625 [Candidatus Acidoferrum sp.]|nr:hypothetical protein [Candidatus Acidoferrum sp.]